MKSKFKFALVILLISLSIFSCQKKDNTIVGKWQHLLIIGQSNLGTDTLDMTQYPPTYNTFREDSTLLVTNGEQEVNVRYFVRENRLYSFALGAIDTSIMEIAKLTSKELILKVMIDHQDQREESLYYKRIE
jgi:hypothetical protein